MGSLIEPKGISPIPLLWFMAHRESSIRMWTDHGSWPYLILMAKSFLLRLARLQTSLLSGRRASVRAYFRLRHQYQNWPRAMMCPNPYRRSADTPQITKRG